MSHFPLPERHGLAKLFKRPPQIRSWNWHWLPTRSTPEAMGGVRFATSGWRDFGNGVESNRVGSRCFRTIAYVKKDPSKAFWRKESVRLLHKSRRASSPTSSTIVSTIALETETSFSRDSCSWSWSPALE